jgi:hypothetical protein
MTTTLSDFTDFQEKVLTEPVDVHKIVVVDVAYNAPPIPGLPRSRISELFAPKFDEFARRYAASEATFYRLQIFQNSWIAQEPYLSNTPHVLFYSKGRMVNKLQIDWTNYENPTEVEDKIKAHLEDLKRAKDFREGRYQ